MWVYCPYSPEELGDAKNPITVLVWGGKKHDMKKGINEIPEEIAQAFFAAALPEQLEKDDKMFEKQVAMCLRRWNKSADKVAFLDGFIVTEKREELETLLADAESKAKEGEKATPQTQAKK